MLSARQVDLDRALALPEASRRLPLAALKAFIEPFAASYRPPFPVRLGIGVDAVTLAAGTLQSVRGDLKLDGDGWDIETLEFRAPGFAQVRLSGRVAHTADGVTFKGPAQIEASDPRTFVAWLEGRAGCAQAPVRHAARGRRVSRSERSSSRSSGSNSSSTARPSKGASPMRARAARKPPRLDAELKAAELDVDGVLAFGRAALDGTAIERPREVSLAVDVGARDRCGHRRERRERHVQARSRRA